MDLVSFGFQALKESHVASTRKRGFKGKGHTLSSKRLDFIKHHSSRSQGSSLRRKGRHTLCNQVSVHKVLAVCVFGKKLPGEGSFAGTVRSGDDVEFHEASYPNESPALRRLL